MTDPLSKVTSSLKADQIITDVIPDFSPTALFSISWPSTGAEVMLGNKIARDLTQEEPEIKILPMQDNGGLGVDEVSYTVVMTDPDAPSRLEPKSEEWRHWVLPGVKLPATVSAETEGTFALKTKPAVTPYYPPAPPAGTGFHRYVFLLFQEPIEGIAIPSDAVEHKGHVKSRTKWSATIFAEKYNLKLVGANFFLAEEGKA